MVGLSARAFKRSRLSSGGIGIFFRTPSFPDSNRRPVLPDSNRRPGSLHLRLRPRPPGASFFDPPGNPRHAVAKRIRPVLSVVTRPWRNRRLGTVFTPDHAG